MARIAVLIYQGPADSASVSIPLSFERKLSQQRTTRTERFLLMAAVIFFPLQDLVPNVAGYSSMFILFAGLGLYVLLTRPNTLFRTWRHPVFLASYVLVAIAILTEFYHSLPDYSHISGIGQMFAGAMLISSFCRDQQSLRAGMYGWLGAGVWVATLAFFSGYDLITSTAATDFVTASLIRGEAFGQQGWWMNTNSMSFITAQGTVVALALGLKEHSPSRRSVFLVIALFCFVATFLAMSRGGTLIVVMSCTAVLVAYGILRIRVLFVAVLLGIAMIVWIPEAVFSRLSFTTRVQDEAPQDSRARIYMAALEYLPEYILTGVGAGNFWGPWGKQSPFYFVYGFRAGVVGAHNCFIQVTIYWGIGAFLALLTVVWLAYRYLPRPFEYNALTLSLFGSSVSLLMWMMVMHNLYFKEFSFGLGMLVGASHWLWPRGTVHSAHGDSILDVLAIVRNS